jgi:DNA-binding NtrC family response regulator
MKNVLIVDKDLGFLFWLGELLAGAKYQPWPACTAADAISLMGSKRTVPLDLLIVDASLRGASRLIDHFRRNRTKLKVIAVDGHSKLLRGVDAWSEKPDPANARERQKWLRAVDRMLSGYKRAA